MSESLQAAAEFFLAPVQRPPRQTRVLRNDTHDVDRQYASDDFALHDRVRARIFEHGRLQNDLIPGSTYREKPGSCSDASLLLLYERMQRLSHRHKQHDLEEIMFEINRQAIASESLAKQFPLQSAQVPFAERKIRRLAAKLLQVGGGQAPREVSPPSWSAYEYEQFTSYSSAGHSHATDMGPTPGAMMLGIENRSKSLNDQSTAAPPPRTTSRTSSYVGIPPRQVSSRGSDASSAGLGQMRGYTAEDVSQAAPFPITEWHGDMPQPMDHQSATDPEEAFLQDLEGGWNSSVLLPRPVPLIYQKKPKALAKLPHDVEPIQLPAVEAMLNAIKEHGVAGADPTTATTQTVCALFTYGQPQQRSERLQVVAPVLSRISIPMKPKSYRTILEEKIVSGEIDLTNEAIRASVMGILDSNAPPPSIRKAPPAARTLRSRRQLPPRSETAPLTESTTKAQPATLDEPAVQRAVSCTPDVHALSRSSSEDSVTNNDTGATLEMDSHPSHAVDALPVPRQVAPQKAPRKEPAVKRTKAAAKQRQAAPPKKATATRRPAEATSPPNVTEEPHMHSALTEAPDHSEPRAVTDDVASYETIDASDATDLPANPSILVSEQVESTQIEATAPTTADTTTAVDTSIDVAVPILTCAPKATEPPGRGATSRSKVEPPPPAKKAPKAAPPATIAKPATKATAPAATTALPTATAKPATKATVHAATAAEKRLPNSKGASTVLTTAAQADPPARANAAKSVSPAREVAAPAPSVVAKAAVRTPAGPSGPISAVASAARSPAKKSAAATTTTTRVATTTTSPPRAKSTATTDDIVPAEQSLTTGVEPDYGDDGFDDVGPQAGNESSGEDGYDNDEFEEGSPARTTGSRHDDHQGSLQRDGDIAAAQMETASNASDHYGSDAPQQIPVAAEPSEDEDDHYDDDDDFDAPPPGGDQFADIGNANDHEYSSDEQEDMGDRDDADDGFAQQQSSSIVNTPPSLIASAPAAVDESEGDAYASALSIALRQRMKAKVSPRDAPPAVVLPPQEVLDIIQSGLTSRSVSAEPQQRPDSKHRGRSRGSTAGGDSRPQYTARDFFTSDDHNNNSGVIDDPSMHLLRPTSRASADNRSRTPTVITPTMSDAPFSWSRSTPPPDDEYDDQNGFEDNDAAERKRLKKAKKEKRRSEGGGSGMMEGFVEIDVGMQPEGTAGKKKRSSKKLRAAAEADAGPAVSSDPTPTGSRDEGRRRRNPNKGMAFDL